MYLLSSSDPGLIEAGLIQFRSTSEQTLFFRAWHGSRTTCYLTTFVANSQGSSFVYYAFSPPSPSPHPTSYGTAWLSCCLKHNSLLRLELTSTGDALLLCKLLLQNVGKFGIGFLNPLILKIRFTFSCFNPTKISIRYQKVLAMFQIGRQRLSLSFFQLHQERVKHLYRYRIRWS